MSRSASLVVLSLCALAACSAKPAVRSEVNPNARFGSYRSYDWVPTSQPPPIGTRLAGIGDWRVRNDVDAALAERGWAHLPAADVRVDYGVVREFKQTESFRDYAAYVEQGGRQSMGSAFVEGFEEGTLVLHIYDGRSGELLWRASASAVLGAEDNAEMVRAAIADMLARLPRD